MASVIPSILNNSVLSQDPTYLKSVSRTNTKFYTSKILNYVESVNIGGFVKTVFYTEYGTNFNVGDRVFVINGNYDSNAYISQDKYAVFTDGYRVLGVDGCRIILDIDYTGILPYQELEIGGSDYIRVTHVSSQREFDYVDGLQVPLQTGSFSVHSNGVWSQFFGEYSVVGGTVSLYNNQIIYSSGTFSSVTPGFWVKDDSSIWRDISSQFSVNKMVSANPDYTGGFIYVVGEDFTYNGQLFKQRVSYRYDGGWKIESKFKTPMISKLNFRSGRFSGVHNDGVFGTDMKSVRWTGGSWNSGLMLNVDWITGIMNSKSSIGETVYRASLANGKIVQTVDLSNNIGRGLNFMIDSTFRAGTINNGNFENCNVGISSGFGALDNYYGITQSQSITVNGGQFFLCDFLDSKVSNAILTNTNIYNSNISGTKLINSQVIRSSASGNSEFNTNSGIKILGADLWSYDEISGSPLPSSTIRGILKLYISDSDLEKLVIGDVFYITRINKQFILSSLDKDQQVLLPIETRFVLDSYLDQFSSDRIKVSLKNKSSNRYKVVVTRDSGGNGVNSVIPNPFIYASIDIDCREFAYYYSDLETAYVSSFDSTKVTYSSYYNLSPIGLDNVNNVFLNCLITDGDFRKGVFEGSKWVSGGNINYQSNRILRPSSSTSFVADGSLNLEPSFDPNRISVFTDYSPLNFDYRIDDFDNQVGDYIWLNSITYATNSTVYGATSVNLDGRYKIVGVTYSTPPVSSFSYSKFLIEKKDSDLDIGTLNLLGGSYYVPGATQNSYVSINNFIISNSTVNGGLFKNTSFRNTKFSNTEFDNTDKNITFTNVEKLRIVNTVFSRTGNDIQSGLVYKSHFVDDTFTGGLVYNSIWNGGKFGSGVANNVSWLTGTFSSGYFINSSNPTPTMFDYDLSPRKKLWMDGKFDLGYFEKSIWLNGTFNNGRFYNSTWYGGLWNNGILGLINLQPEVTTMGFLDPVTDSATYTVWKDGVVENAVVGGSGSVYWYNGKFNNGEFTSYGTVSSNESIWYDGEFNGGKFMRLARWKNGKFNGGKFTSYYGIGNVSPTQSSNVASDYAWEFGRFNGGEFGNASTATNSVWFDGEFNGGIFQGRFWRYGLFRNGSFNGSGVLTTTQSSPEFLYADSFRTDYYGLWKDGWVAESLPMMNDYQVQASNLYKGNNIVIQRNQAKLNNILWLSGTFSHQQGNLNNSLWLGGSFNRGTFDGGVFNPFVDRQFAGVTANSSFNTQSSVWNDGVFASGSFYMSEWKKGVFQNGLMSGAIWRNGTWNYGTAENIYWETGLWRNGNWDGSPYGVDSLTGSNQVVKKVSLLMSNVAQAASSNNIHIINAFTGSVVSVKNISLASNPIGTDLIQSLSGTAWSFSSTYSGPFGTVFLNNLKVTTNGSNSRELTVASASSPLSLDPNTKYTVTFRSLISGVPLSSTLTSILNIDYGSGSTSSRIGVWPPGAGGGGPFIWPSGDPGNIQTFTFETGPSPSNLKFKVYSSTSLTTNIFSISVDKQDINYYPTYNNKLYPGVSASVGSTASLPTTLTVLEATSDNPVNNAYQRVSTRFGNGVFKSGIWENGVWNNGWRDDTTVTKFIVNTSANYISLNKTTHRMFLTVVDNDITRLSQFRVGNWVTCGNLVGIDIDEKRVLLWNKFRVIVVGGDYLIVEYINNFPLKRIEVDSSDHIVYVTKNMWMTGVFLNGYFTGVWNSGWFKGYPYITKMDKTYWVDGKFDGGHFISGIDSYTYSGITYSYHTGLVQNMDFRDNNVARPYQFTYQSWMDINWTSTSMTNIGDGSIWSTQSDSDAAWFAAATSPSRTSRIDLNGYITNDILSSTSVFRKGNRSTLRTLSLGTKYTILDQFLPNDGNFTNAFSSLLDPPGTDNFINDGWVFSLTTSTSFEYEAAISEDTFKLTSTYSDGFKLDNPTNVTVLPERYTMIDVGVSYIDYPSTYVYTSYTKATYSLFGGPSNFINYAASGSNGKEYYFNKPDLGLYVFFTGATSPREVRLSNVSLYEVDRIPFFQYTTESNVDKSIMAPWKATAPFINFSTDFVYNNYLSAVSFRLDATSLGSITALPLGAAASSIYSSMASATIDTSGAASGGSSFF